MAGHCGTCTMCCKVMAVTELEKEKNTNCQFCDKGVGCQIYDDRPHGCKVFSCMWLMTQVDSSGGAPMSPALRPDKCKVVLHGTPDNRGIIAKPDKGFPTAWEHGEIAQFLGAISMLRPVLVDNGKQYYSIENRAIREVRMSKPDENNIEWFEGYVNAN